MPTLRPISSHADRQAYHRFRHAVYADSIQSGFLSGTDGNDRDAYDGHALHLGWYEGERLVGCVRMINPVPGPEPLHFFKDLPDEALKQQALALLRDARLIGKPLCEVGRLCLAPEYRSIASIRRFVLDIIATGHRYGKDHCLFSCNGPHAAFWRRMGFTPVDGFQGYPLARCAYDSHLMRGDYQTLLARNREELQRIGWELLTPVAHAA